MFCVRLWQIDGWTMLFCEAWMRLGGTKHWCIVSIDQEMLSCIVMVGYLIKLMIGWALYERHIRTRTERFKYTVFCPANITLFPRLPCTAGVETQGKKHTISKATRSNFGVVPQARTTSNLHSVSLSMVLGFCIWCRGEPRYHRQGRPEGYMRTWSRHLGCIRS